MLAVEQEMGKDVTFTVGYVGTYAVRPVVNMNANASAPGGGSAGGLLSQLYGANYTGTINELTPFKNSPLRFAADDSRSTGLRGGSNIRASYTWSKALSYADNEDLGSLSFPYPTYWHKNYGPAAFDRTDNFELSGVIALPFGKGDRGCRTVSRARFLADGW